MPPRHGKSELISKYYPAWLVGTFPDFRVILASYEADFAAQWGRKARDILEEFGRPMFGVSVRQDSSAANRWDIVGDEGGMVTAGARGAITGKGANCAVVDDPIKNAQEAASETIRNAIWEWFESVLMTRLHKGGSVILVMTRWHQDDLVGRTLNHYPGLFRRIRMPAIAEENERWCTGWKRREGQALCPDLIPMTQLQERMRNDYWWATLYQQRPYQRGGGMFWVEKMRERILLARIDPPFTAVRSWDLAATIKATSKRTAGVRMVRDRTKRIAVEHIRLGKWRPDERNAIILATAKADGRGVKILIEHEGGSAGEDQKIQIGKLLQGYSVEFIKASGDKAVRAEAFAAQANIGNIYVVDDGSWDIEAFFAEAEAFPNGTYLDQIDAASQAFNWITGNTGRLRPSGERKIALPSSRPDRLQGYAPDRDSVSVSDFYPGGA